MLQFDPQNYGPAVADLLSTEPLCQLGPGHPAAEVRNALDELDTVSVFNGQAIADQEMAKCCLAGLWLLFDYLAESHTISQSITSPSGSYWHGIMHRREPDFPNAKYWFRRVGQRPVFADLAEDAGEVGRHNKLTSGPLLARQWDPLDFVDLCQTAIRERGKLEEICREVARAEWRLLFHFCYQRALGN